MANMVWQLRRKHPNPRLCSQPSKLAFTIPNFPEESLSLQCQQQLVQLEDHAGHALLVQLPLLAAPIDVLQPTLTVAQDGGAECEEVGGDGGLKTWFGVLEDCLLYTSPSPRDRQKSRMPSSA